MTRKKNRASGGLTATESPESGSMSYTLSDFPEIRRHEQRCRMCRLVTVAPDLLKEVHREYAKGVGAKGLHATYGERAGAAAAALPQSDGKVQVYSAMTFIRHLDQHVGPPELAATAMAVRSSRSAVPAGRKELPIVPIPPPAEALSTAQMGKALPEVAAPPIGASDEDYTELWALYSKLKPILDKVCEDTLSKLKPDAEGKTVGITSYDAVMLSKLYSEARGTLGDLNRIKNSDRLIKLILETAGRNVILRVAEVVANPFVVLKGHLERGDVGQAMQLIGEVLGGGLVQDLTTTAQQALALTQEQYKLH